MAAKHEGLNTHRLKDNPEEKRFAKAWQRINDTGSLLDYLLGDKYDGRPVEANEREAQVAATVVQWLGSPVGQGFLAELGYKKGSK